MDDFGMIDIDAPLPDDSAHIDVIDVAAPPPPKMTAPTPASQQPQQRQSSLSSQLPVALDGLADIPALEQPSDAEPSFEATSSPTTSSSTFSTSFSTSQSAILSFDPPILAAPATRFLDAFTPLAQPADPAAAAPTAPLASTAASLRDQLSAYKRRKTEQSSARTQLNALVKRGGEDFIDLNPYATMGSPQPPPVRPSSAAGSAERSVESALFAPWMVREYRHTNFTLRLHEELLDFAAFISPTSGEEKRRAALLSRLSDLTSSLFPSSSLRPFGSYATKLYLPMGDIDCCLFDAPSNALHQLHRALEREGWASYLEHITSARIPIVKFMDRTSGLRVDVCMDQRVGLDAAQYIVQMSVRFPAFRPLLLFLKYFLHVRRLNDTYSGGVGSYLLQLMLLSHLHHHPAQTLDVNLGLLLLSFFDTYGNQLNYQNVGLSLSPPAFYNKHDRQRFNPQRPLLLSVENPLDGSHDVGLNSFGVMRVRRAMQYGYGRLTERSVMEGRWEDSLLAMVLGVTDDEELRERGEKKDKQRRKSQKRDKKERKEAKKARREKREREQKEETERDREEEEEGEITIIDDSDDEKASAGRDQASEPDEEEEEGAYHEHSHHSDEEKEKDHDNGGEMREEETKEVSVEETETGNGEDERSEQSNEHNGTVGELKDEKAEPSSVPSSAEQLPPATSSSSIPISSSPPSTSTSPSTSKKWRPGSPFPDKWLKLFSAHEVSVILEQMELDDAAQAKALEQFKREKQAWLEKRLNRRRDKKEKQQHAELDALSEQKEEAKEAKEGRKDAAPATIEQQRKEAEERYFLSWRAHQPFPTEWVRLFTPSQMSDLLDRRTDIDSRTKRRLLLDFKRDKDGLRDQLANGDTAAPITVETWQRNQPIPAQWLQQYTDKQMKDLLDKRADLGKKSRQRMLQQFREDKLFMHWEQKDIKGKRVAEELKAQPGLYEVQEDWLLMTREQVDQLLQERGMAEELRMAVLAQWRDRLMGKTNAEERKRRIAERTWTSEDAKEWEKWRWRQKFAATPLPATAQQDGGEAAYSIPVEWLKWDRHRITAVLSEWRIHGSLRSDVLLKWREMKQLKEAGIIAGKSRGKAEQTASEQQLKDELVNLAMYRQQEQKRSLKHLQAGIAAVAAENAAERGVEPPVADQKSKKRQRQKDEDEEYEQEEQEEDDSEREEEKREKKPGSSSKRQRLEKEDNHVDDEPRPSKCSSRLSAKPKPIRRAKLKAMLTNEVQQEALERLKRERTSDAWFPHTADDHKLYRAEWERVLEERVEAELAGKPRAVQRGVGNGKSSQPPTAEESPLSQAELSRVRRQLRTMVYPRLLAEEQEKRAAAGEAKNKRPFPDTAADHQLYNGEVDKALSSKTPAEWRRTLLESAGVLEAEERKQAAAERYPGVDAATVKQVRRRLIEQYRKQRRNEYVARKEKPPTHLDKLFPVDGSDQRKLEEALVKELDRIRQAAGGSSSVDQNGHGDGSSASKGAAASAAAEPEVIDLVDDDDSDVSTSPAAAAYSGVGEAEGWVEETSARPKRRAQVIGDAKVFGEQPKEEHPAQSSKRVKTDADKQQSNE